MEVQTTQKNIGNTPRKLRLVAQMVRKMKPEQAIERLEFTRNAAAEPLKKAIKTVLANASHARKGEWGFKSIEINEGLKMKRYRVGTAGRGRGRPYKRRLSHIRIVLSNEVETKGQRDRESERKRDKGTKRQRGKEEKGGEE